MWREAWWGGVPGPDELMSGRQSRQILNLWIFLTRYQACLCTGFSCIVDRGLELFVAMGNDGLLGKRSPTVSFPFIYTKPWCCMLNNMVSDTVHCICNVKRSIEQCWWGESDMPGIPGMPIQVRWKVRSQVFFAHMKWGINGKIWSYRHMGCLKTRIRF